MKYRTKRGKTAIKKWGFREKKWVIELQKSWVSNQTRKVKRCKMQVLFLKTDKTKGVKGKK